MTSVKNINQDFFLEDNNLKNIVDSLEYLQTEASNGGFDEISEMVSMVVDDIKSQEKITDSGFASTEAGNNNEAISLPKVVELLDTFSALDKTQLEALGKIVNLVK